MAPITSFVVTPERRNGVMLLEIIVRVKHRSPFTLIHKPNFIRNLKNVAFIRKCWLSWVVKSEPGRWYLQFLQIFHNALDHRRTQAAVYFVHHHRLALLASIVECREQRQGTQCFPSDCILVSRLPTNPPLPILSNIS